MWSGLTQELVQEITQPGPHGLWHPIGLMASDWFCKISGEQYGPLSSTQLKAMAAKRELAPDDWVRQGEDGSWIAASQVKGLFSAGEPAHPKPEPAQPTGQLPVARAAPLPPAPPGETAAQTSSPMC